MHERVKCFSFSGAQLAGGGEEVSPSFICKKKKVPWFYKKKHEAFIEVPLFQETFLALKNSWFRA